MTQKEFFESIMNSDVITEEMKTHAADELARLRLAPRSARQRATQRMTDSRKQFSRASLRERRWRAKRSQPHLELLRRKRMRFSSRWPRTVHSLSRRLRTVRDSSTLIHCRPRKCKYRSKRAIVLLFLSDKLGRYTSQLLFLFFFKSIDKYFWK